MQLQNFLAGLPELAISSVLNPTLPSVTMMAGDGGLVGYELLVDLVLAIIAAFVGGLIAARLKLPVIIGYLLAGIAIGPFTPGPVSDVHRVQTMAELGVALLMFALGTQFSLNELKHVGRGAIGGGLLQVLLTIAGGIPLGLLLGLPFSQSFYLGGMLAISSSIVMLKLLLSRGELDSIQGKLALGVGVVQDLAVVVLVVVLPAVATAKGELSETLVAVGLALLKAAAFLGVTYFAGTRLIPPLLYRIIGLGLRELFLMTVLIIAVGLALLAQLIGISFALGAFLAGLIVSESDAADDVLNEIIPIRDVFATLFFVSIGMLIDPLFIWRNLGEVLAIVVFILLAKFGIIAGLFWLFRYPVSGALKAGLLLAQIGEFSFVLARSGVEKGAISPRVESLTLASAMLTIILVPILYQTLPGFFSRLDARRIERLARLANQREAAQTAPITDSLAEPDYNRVGRDPQLDKVMEHKEHARDTRSAVERWPYKKHILICGYGRVGRELVDAVRKRNFDVAIIEFDIRRAAEAQQQGLVVITGDSTQEYVLKLAHIQDAKVLAVTTPDLTTAEAITRLGRKLNPQLEIIARSSAADWRAIRALREVGATTVVQPEVEASLEFIRRTLRSYGVSSVELTGLINGRREVHYGKS